MICSVPASLAIALAVCLAFPLTGLALVLFAVVDFLLPRHLKEAGGEAVGIP